MIELAGIKNCSTVKKTIEWLKSNEVEFEFRDLKKSPFSSDELKTLFEFCGSDRVVNRRGMKWRNLGLSGKELSEQELLEITLANQTMIKRPVVKRDESFIVGFNEDEFRSFLDIKE
ncbi:MAG: arsenate reductase family protein [Balneolales bacterium]|nr:arsenate reductase family protein [Balneolales bacterium]